MRNWLPDVRHERHFEAARNGCVYRHPLIYNDEEERTHVSHSEVLLAVRSRGSTDTKPPVER